MTRRRRTWLIAAVVAVLAFVTVNSWLRAQRAIGRAEEAERVAVRLAKKADAAADTADALARQLSAARERYDRDTARLAAARRAARASANEAAAVAGARLDTLRNLVRPGLQSMVDSVRAAHTRERDALLSLAARLTEERDAERRLRIRVESALAVRETAWEAEHQARLAAERAAEKWKSAALGSGFDPFRHMSKAFRVAAKAGIGAAAYLACDAVEGGAGKWCVSGYATAILISGP